MRLFAGLLFALALALPAAPADTNQAKDLTAEELGKLLEQKGKVFFLDVRPAAEIEALGSVKGYVNIPLDQLESRLKEIPKDKLIVTL
jgi:rhodanese-related sulfurtransferase